MKYKVSLNNRIYEVEVEKGEAMLLDEYDAKAPAAPVPSVKPDILNEPVTQAPLTGTAKGESVTAPLPGNIMNVCVTPGQAVKKGHQLVIIEAMKMENEVLAPCDGTIKEILVKKGDAVKAGDVLLII